MSGVGGGVDGWTEEQAQKQICPFNFFEVGGHNNALMYKLLYEPMNFFNKKTKCNFFFFFLGGGGVGMEGWAR